MTLFEYIDNYIKNYDHVANNETAMIRYCFELKRLIKKYPEKLRNKLDRDIECLVNNPKYFLDFEISIFNIDNKLHSAKFHLFEKFLTHYSGKEIDRTSTLIYENEKYSLISLYALNIKLTEQLRKRLIQVYEKFSVYTRRKYTAIYRKALENSKLYPVSKDLYELLNVLIISNELMTSEKQVLKSLMQIKSCIVEVDGVQHEITQLTELNSSIKKDYEIIVSRLNKKFDYRRLFRFTSIVVKHLNKNPDDLIQFKKFGLHSIIENNYEILLKFKEYLTLKNFYMIVFIMEKLLDKEINYHPYDKSCIYLYYDTGLKTSVGLKKLAKVAPIFSEQLRNFISNYISDIEYKDESMITINSHTSKLVNIFENYCDHDALEKYGLDILEADDNYYFRLIKSRIYERYKQKTLKTLSMQSIFNGLKWFCKIRDTKYIQDYDQAYNTNKALINRDRIKGCYSIDEIKTLWKYLTIGVDKYADDCNKLMLLYFAMILMLTGWNTSSLCSLKTNNVEPDKNISNLFHVKFVKARANYKVETYSFFKKSKDKTIYLLLYVKDILRKAVLEKSVDPNFNDQDYMFIYLSQSDHPVIAQVQNISYRINEILDILDCPMRFNMQKIRKTTSNEGYTLALQDYSVYKDFINHQLQVFIRHYEQIDIIESNSKLMLGTKALEEYLKREINFDIPLINDTDSNIIQFTPIGNCSEPQINNIPMCSDYMACLFCKNFSIVNSEAQIHKLLDFKNICIEQMVNLSSLFPPESNTKLAINEFSDRIEHILNLLKESNTQAYNLALINYVPNKYFTL
ncbi:hypothetical protein ACBP83_05410 [Acinetobacter pseudolwoffii]|uniref:hypothetical protein n=1 Tax=Acinetobacter pseudolwoffii TaxID=2053287 RepID=UPI003523982B